MIKSAAASVSSSLALGLGAQAAPADDAAVSTDFAALLDSTVATGQDGVTDQAASLETPVGKKMRQAIGSAAGKKLPQGPDAAATLSDAAKLADGSADADPATDETAPALPPITTEIVLPGLVVPISLQLPQPPAPAAAPVATTAPAASAAPVPMRQSTTESLAQTAAAQAIRSPLPAATEPVPAKAPETADAGSVATATPAPAMQIAASFVLPKADVAPPASRAAAPRPVDSATTAPAPATVPAATSTAAPAAEVPTFPDNIRMSIALTESSASRSKPASAKAAPAPISEIVASSPTVAEHIRVTVAPAQQPAPIPTSTSAQLASAQAINQPVATAKATASDINLPAAPLPADAVVPAAAVPALATTAQVASAQAMAVAAQTNGAAAPRREAAAPRTVSPTVDAPATPAQTATAEATAAPAQAFDAPLAQPMIALQDGLSFSQATAPVTSASATSGVSQTGHDFAALVDRLVEARESASPGTVHAAITHSEFGQVSLRFEQDANGLSVAMSSADPDFAKAVQASSAGAQTGSDNGSGPPRHDRQDTPGQQQTAGSPSGQAQSQAQSQAQPQSSASGRGDRNSQTQTDSRSGRTSGQQTQDNEATDARGGIYA